MKGIKQAFDRITSKVVNSQRGCGQCASNDCSECKKRKLPVDENGVPPPPGCCDLKVAPFFGSFIEPITSTEFSTTPFTILTTNGVDQCQVTLEFNSQCPDNNSNTYLNINGTDNLLPNNIPVQYSFNDGDIIFLKTLHQFVGCSLSFTTIYNVSCQIDYGVAYDINFGDPSCDFCPPWQLIPIQQSSTTIYSPANFPIFPPPPTPGWSYKNTTSQPIDLFFDPIILNPGINTFAELWLLENGSLIHLLYDGTTTFPIIYTLGVGQIIGFKQSCDGGCLETETFINNETCDIFIGSQIMHNTIGC